MQPTDIALDSEPADLDYLFGVAELTRLCPGLMQALEQQVFIAASAVNAGHARLLVCDQLGGQLTAHWPTRPADRRADGLRLVMDRVALRPLEGTEPVHAQLAETLDGPDLETVNVIRLPIVLGERLLRAELSLVGAEGHDRIDPGHPVLRAVIALIQQSLTGILRHLADTRRLAAMYLASPALLYFLDGSGNIVAASDLWLRHFGYRREDVIGRNARNFMTRQSRQAFMKVRTGLWRSGGCRDYPCQFVKQNGEVVDALLSASIEFDRHGWPINVKCALNDVTELLRLQRGLESGQQRDALTQVARSEAFEERLMQEVARAQRHESVVSLVRFHVEGLNRIQAESGRRIADQLLRDLVEITRVVIRGTDEIGRVSDDGFALMLPHTDSAGAWALVDRLRAAVAFLRQAAPDRAALRGVSFGLASSEPGLGSDELLARAEVALQSACSAGIDQAVSWDGERVPARLDPDPGEVAGEPLAARS